jgi:hypothetical protein
MLDATGPPPVMSIVRHAMSAGSKRSPRNQAAPSGGPPKPPKKAAKGLEDGSPDPELTRLDFARAKLQLADRLIAKASEQLLDPSLSAGKRAELRKLLTEIRQDRRRFEDPKKGLEKWYGQHG